jgi:oligopeptide transport system substrate-binding protein
MGWMARLGILILALSFVVTQAGAETVLRRGNGAEPGSLDPQAFDTTVQTRIEADLFEGLTASAPGGAVTPAQAERWSASPDGKVWTFALRPNLKWSNGDPLTAEDFVYSFRRLVDPANAFMVSFMAEPIRNALDIIKGRQKDTNQLGVEAPDPLTVRITLDTPNPALPEILTALYPVHRASVEALGRDAFRPGNMVSNGAFRLVVWRPQAVIAVARNQNYWDAEHVKIDRVEFYPIEDRNEELKRYRAGDLDVTVDLPLDQIDFIERTLGDQYKKSPSFGLYFIGLNSSRPPFKDNPKLREALTLAINRETLVDKIIRGGAEPAYGWIPRTVEHYANASFPGAELDQPGREALAQRLYAEAGYSASHPAEFELLYNTNENHKKIMIAIAGMWKRVLGATVRLSNQEFKAFVDRRLAKQTTEAFRAGFLAPYRDPQPMLEILRSGSGFNDMGYANPRFDALFDKAAGTVDPALRMDLFAQAEAVALADFPGVPIYYSTVGRLIKPYVIGWRPGPHGAFRSQDLQIQPH